MPSTTTTVTTTTYHIPPLRSDPDPDPASSSSSSSNPSQIQASLNFFVPPTDGNAPYNYVEQAPSGVPRNNFNTASHTVPISDMRGLENTFSLDTHAFLPIPANDLTTSSMADFNSSDDQVVKTYYPEIERLLLNHLPGSPRKVIIFDHTIRRSSPGAKREPVMRTHIDQTPKSARERVYLHCPEDAEELLKSRVRLVNVWRPLNGPVESSPLAVADSSTVREELLVPVEHRYPNRTGETAAVRFDKNVKWWFWSGMRNEERLLLQCFDSGKGARVPHSAFRLPGEGEEGWSGKGRESCEVRALVFG